MDKWPCTPVTMVSWCTEQEHKYVPLQGPGKPTSLFVNQLVNFIVVNVCIFQHFF